ncbi:LPXTG cell wall anchor domain-containing protein [Facklamia sp. DSM 111018]|uniref:LPXTG cell wall anchor domain-containing protein n=1 Tax=Facklamia lactis TaxID=2749967 RepID=A0ABS0LS15_9LACT|nr:LPXTG cell wall anchor domain-containing protein [Facklamia lactis]MBG9981149.1 LPXTG cell wall anchor domain-containing protein [Facklamia lactis]MBG9986950.1 LPXTG cell wall anchor domain-containing protein [Facklamia lactis]
MKVWLSFLLITFLLLGNGNKIYAHEMLPQTGERSSWLVILIAFLALIAGIFLVAKRKKK